MRLISLTKMKAQEVEFQTKLREDIIAIPVVFDEVGAIAKPMTSNLLAQMQVFSSYLTEQTGDFVQEAKAWEKLCERCETELKLMSWLKLEDLTLCQERALKSIEEKWES